jgi:hypothetical protein
MTPCVRRRQGAIAFGKLASYVLSQDSACLKLGTSTAEIIIPTNHMNRSDGRQAQLYRSNLTEYLLVTEGLRIGGSWGARPAYSGPHLLS